jgi:hypothetical protein
VDGWAVAVEKLEIPEIRARIGIGNWSGDLYKSFIGHPDAMLFWPFPRSLVFQQVRLFATAIGD